MVRNAKRHFGEITFLQLCSYALMMELNEYKMIQSLRLQAEPFQITNENEAELQEGQKVRRTVHGIVGKCTLLKHQLISRDERGCKSCGLLNGFCSWRT